MIETKGKIEDTILNNINRVFNYVKDMFSLPENIKVNLSFITEKQIQKLNKKTRGIDKVTDVLTYPYVNLKPNQTLNLNNYLFDIDPIDNTLTIGDIYICKEKAKQQANEYNHSFNREICFLFCHAMLHILGYDHIDKKDAEIMEQKQNDILDALEILRGKFKCGFVTIIGETNTGKSTLINALVKENVAIVSPKSQTTRENIRGIYNDKNSQIVFVDTPGFHKNNYKIDAEMDKQIDWAKQDTEVILMLIVAKKDLIEQYDKLIKKVNSNAKKILLINKIDETNFEKMYPKLLELSKHIKVDEILPISALKNKNIDVLIDMIKKYLPEYDEVFRYYPVDEYTDKNLRHMCSEIIREKALLLLDDEVPHGVQVVITDYKENENPIQICADLYCEKESHKAIILGKSGEMIKNISTRSRIAIEKLVNARVNLQIYVKVKPNWRNDINAIESFGLKFSE